MQHTISLLLYVDDIKIYAPTQTLLKGLVKITETFATDIQMKFDISKCEVLHIEKGKWTDTEEPLTTNS